MYWLWHSISQSTGRPEELPCKDRLTVVDGNASGHVQPFHGHSVAFMKR
jgi:hypothetical protein